MLWRLRGTSNPWCWMVSGRSFYVTNTVTYCSFPRLQFYPIPAANDIGNDGAIALSEALSFNVALSRLSIKENGITDEGLPQLTFSLRSKPQLTSLNISGNDIGNEGSQNLARSLLGMRNLSELNIARCNLGEFGAIAAAGS